MYHETGRPRLGPQSHRPGESKVTKSFLGLPDGAKSISRDAELASFILWNASFASVEKH